MNGTTESHEKVKVELVEAFGFRQRPCHVCGNETEKVAIHAEVMSGPDKGFRVCETCIERRNFDAALIAHAESLEEMSSALRRMVGRLEVPTFQEYQAASRHADRAAKRAYKKLKRESAAREKQKQPHARTSFPDALDDLPF